MSGAAFVMLGVLLCASPAHADESEGARLFREGRALLLDGRFDEACPMLEQSQQLEPHVGTLLNLAACHERQGKVGSAWVEYQKALTAARTEGQAERAQLAEQRIAVLEPRVPWLRISSALDDTTITLDGGEIARVAWGQEMPVDPGLHVVVAERGGDKVFEERVELRESERRSVRVVSDRSADASAPPRGDPARLVVEPKPEPVGVRAPPARKRGRWIFEPGVFVGYLGGGPSHSRLDNPASVALLPRTAGQAAESCASKTCESGDIARGGGAAVGINLFGGYALGDQIDLGIRVIGAPSVSGGGVWGFGPSVVLHPTEALSLGLWGLFGDASFSGKANVTGPPEYNVSPQSATAEGVLAGGVGAGIELSVRLFELGRGTVVANTTPFFLGGNGNAFCVPIGLAYRFQ